MKSQHPVIVWETLARAREISNPRPMIHSTTARQEDRPGSDEWPSQLLVSNLCALRDRDSARRGLRRAVRASHNVSQRLTMNEIDGESGLPQSLPGLRKEARRPARKSLPILLNCSVWGDLSRASLLSAHCAGSALAVLGRKIEGSNSFSGLPRAVRLRLRWLVGLDSKSGTAAVSPLLAPG